MTGGTVRRAMRRWAGGGERMIKLMTPLPTNELLLVILRAAPLEARWTHWAWAAMRADDVCDVGGGTDVYSVGYASCVLGLGDVRGREDAGGDGSGGGPRGRAQTRHTTLTIENIGGAFRCVSRVTLVSTNRELIAH
jgi:hypothetical protein